jgi:HEPN domain-containing protein
MKKLTAEWVRKAEEDYQVAAKTHRGGDPFHNAVCFHCQQAVEKYLKALMEERGLSVPKTHDLDGLRTLLVPHYAQLPARRGLVFLTRFAMETRYPRGLRHPTRGSRRPALGREGSCGGPGAAWSAGSPSAPVQEVEVMRLGVAKPRAASLQYECRRSAPDAEEPPR